MIKKIFRTILIVIITVIILFVVMVLVFRFSRSADKTVQLERLEQLNEQPPEIIEISDTLIDDNLRLNQIRYLATHNSYHKQAGPVKLAVLDLFQPGAAETLKYSHLDFYRQLELGVRSFEFDLRCYRSGNIENIHVPLVDNRGPSPLFKPALEEMKLWSERHPLHVPVIVIMQTKEDWMFLDPGLKKWSVGALLDVDRTIADVMKDRLITPSNIKGQFNSVREGLRKNGWPGVGDSRGKFIFVFHESEADYFNQQYFDSPERASFFMDSPDSPEASFILRNDPDAEDIKTLISDGFIVRTRADADCIFSEEQKDKAVASGAQIVSTDYPKGYAHTGNYSLGWRELLSRYIY